METGSCSDERDMPMMRHGLNKHLKIRVKGGPGIVSIVMIGTTAMFATKVYYYQAMVVQKSL